MAQTNDYKERVEELVELAERRGVRKHSDIYQCVKVPDLEILLQAGAKIVEVNTFGDAYIHEVIYDDRKFLAVAKRSYLPDVKTVR